MSYREGQFHTNRPWASTTLWQSFVYSFGHYSMSRTTSSYRIPFDRQKLKYKIKVNDSHKIYVDSNTILMIIVHLILIKIIKSFNQLLVIPYII